MDWDRLTLYWRRRKKKGARQVAERVGRVTITTVKTERKNKMLTVTKTIKASSKDGSRNAEKTVEVKLATTVPEAIELCGGLVDYSGEREKGRVKDDDKKPWTVLDHFNRSYMNFVLSPVRAQVQEEAEGEDKKIAKTAKLLSETSGISLEDAEAMIRAKRKETGKDKNEETEAVPANA